MIQEIERVKKWCLMIVGIQIAALFGLFLFLKQTVIIGILCVIVEVILGYFIFDRFEKTSRIQSSGVKSILGTSAAEAFLQGGIGMLLYDDDYMITWMSDLFMERHLDHQGERLLVWIPEADDVISGKNDHVFVRIDERLYEISRKKDAPLLYFKDITEIDHYQHQYEEGQIVLGLASFDNYEESTMYADDADVASINAAIRTPLNEYCSQYGMFSRRLSNNRYLFVLNEKIFQQLVQDKFSILGKIRKVSSKLDVTITLSMAFSHGSSDFLELDENVTKLMDLAKTRGGDQVATQKIGEDVAYFGGSTEAQEKRSRVRVRINGQAIRDLMMKSTNVIICGHKMADFDCFGSAICLSRLASSLNKPVCIIGKTGGVEEKLAMCLKQNEKQLKNEVSFVTESEALNQYSDNTLVIMTDHHSKAQSNGAKVLDIAKKVVIIDHHRRSTDMGVQPILIYIEAGASSTCELVTEMIPYISSKAEISPLDATIMLAGMTIDTRKWRVRTGSRTYDAASNLRKYGADPQVAYDYLKDSFEEFALKSQVMSLSQKYAEGIVIIPVKDRSLSRSFMSQVADSLLSIQGIEAAFVIASDPQSGTCISARSNGKINVQLIMEALKGGGHMSAAATQRKDVDVDGLEAELRSVLDTYMKEGESA